MRNGIKVIVTGEVTPEMKSEFNDRLIIALVSQFTKEGTLTILKSLKEDYDKNNIE